MQNTIFSVEQIQAWLISKLSEELQLNPEDIDIQEPFARYGLNSMTAVSLSGDLEHWLGMKLSATLAWDYPTIEALANHLQTQLQS